ASQSLMLAMARRAARDIEQRLVSSNPVADRVLLERFLRARRGARGPLVGLNGQATYTNAPAVRLLQDTDHALLWDLVSPALVDQPRALLELPFPAGGSSFVSCEAIVDGGHVVGALLRFLSAATMATGNVAKGRRHGPT